MKNRDQYKRFLRIAAGAGILTIQIALFVLTWYTAYKEVGANQFVRGNLVVIGLYALMIMFFYYIFGGFEIGRSRVFEIFYSQTLSTLGANVVTYLQL